MTESERKSWFERDVDAYLEALPRLLVKDEGKFVLVRNGELVSGLHESYDDAMAFGYQHFAGKVFLAKQISSKDQQLETCRS